MKKPLLLCIMDGFGIAKPEGNAIYAAKTPNLDKLFSENPFTTIGASGMDVGLPDGQMGNSEVGHTNIGAGRVVFQELTNITNKIRNGSFFENEALLGAIENCKSNGTALHLIGLVSDGGVHSHNTHLYAILEMAKQHGLEKVYVHAVLDGRDVPPASGADYIAELQAKMAEIGVGKVATTMGRFYCMDRDSRWERLQLAYNAIVCGEGEFNPDAVAAIKKSYETIDADGKHLTDEFVLPVVCEKGAELSADDSVIFFNFRPDRAREITRSLVDEGFDKLERKKGFFPLYYVCFTQYDATMPNVQIAFKPISLDNVLGQYLADNGMTQLRIAETEKYAHVTFFFNGGREVQFDGEDRALIPSPKVTTYDLKPSMSAVEVANEVVARVESGNYDVVILNFANCDMVGHTGIFEAAVEAVETVDASVGRVWAAVEKMGGVMLITADHGNADKMLDDDGTPFTAHSTNPVPFCVVGYPCALREGGRLADIAPTMLKILALPQPTEMDGVSLIV